MTVVGTIGKVIGTLLLICVITGVILICLAAGYIRSVVIPQAHLEANFVMNQTSTIYYMDSSTGEYVEHLALHGAENRVLVDYEDIPQDLINATVAIEDRTFREHNGVNWRRTIYGVILMFTGQDIQGGSTITQQLIKNVTQYDDVTVKRKIQEIFTALDFDATYSKEQIMEWYLNYIFLGDSCYGVGTAAKNYFGKDGADPGRVRQPDLHHQQPHHLRPQLRRAHDQRKRGGHHGTGAQQAAAGAGALDHAGGGLYRPGHL